MLSTKNLIGFFLDSEFVFHKILVNVVIDVVGKSAQLPTTDSYSGTAHVRYRACR